MFRIMDIPYLTEDCKLFFIAKEKLVQYKNKFPRKNVLKVLSGKPVMKEKK